MQRRQERWLLIGRILADFGVYLFVLVGIILSRYMPQFKSGDELIWIPLSWLRLAISALIALMIVGSVDLNVGEQHAGKRRPRRLLSRIALAVSQGFMWETIIG